jgi:pullulanase/glycogen debranching enzyme
MVKQFEIWHLNSRSGYDRNQSSNNNPGYPQFNFVVRYDWKTTKDFSSWSTYFAYLYALRNNQILFDAKTYFTETGRFYKENGESYQYEYPEYPYINYPGIVASTSSSNTAVEIGAIKLEKIDYYSNYLAIYSEEEISKIKNISVKQLK